MIIILLMYLFEVFTQQRDLLVRSELDIIQSYYSGLSDVLRVSKLLKFLNHERMSFLGDIYDNIKKNEQFFKFFRRSPAFQSETKSF